MWENIPVFPRAEIVRQEEALANNTPVQISIYSTSVQPEEVAEFYKTRLANFGWKLEIDTAQQGVAIMNFMKGEKFLSIIQQSINGKNIISVSQRGVPKAPSEEPPCADCQQQPPDPGSAAAPVQYTPGQISYPKADLPGGDLQFVPRYPGAVRINSLERGSSMKTSLAYYTSDPVDRVVDFYRQNMGTYNWNLEQSVDLKDLPGGIPPEIDQGFTGKTLVFKSSLGSCIISIFHKPKNNVTVIGVNYDAK